jgi:isopropylmalate/homocitrate/citramalate synthase
MDARNPMSVLDDDDRRVLAEARARIDEQTARLRDLVPCVLDMSLREATLAIAHGHTLDDKIELFRLAKDFGFTDFGLPNVFDFPSVADLFLDHLVEAGIDLDQFLMTFAVEPTEAGAPLPMTPAARKAAEIGITNVILLIEIRPATLAKIGRTQDQALGDIERYVSHYRSELPAESDRRGRIYVRIADAYDGFDEDPAFVLRVFKLLGALPITGILFEDVRGSRFTFETAALVRLMRAYSPPPRKILVHPHSGNGMEDAATIEAVLAGADGVWAGFTPQAAQGAHGSSMMFLSNLMRARNRHVAKAFRCQTLAPTAEAMWQIQDRHGIPPNQPVVGERAYRYVDEYFEQTDRPCDLSPQSIGREPGYQVTPAWAPAYVIGKRLEELGHGPEVTQNRKLLTTLRMLINRSQMAGHHVPFDQPEELAKLVAQAQEHLRGTNVEVEEPDTAAALTQRYR